jgi:NUDIX domain-containing protein
MTVSYREDSRTRYVVGFVLTPTHVLLTRKIRPDWQRGKWNGIGGHVEVNESEEDAMHREYHEEVTGGRPLHWTSPLQMNGGTWTCAVFVAFADDVFAISSTNDVGEPLAWLRIDGVTDPQGLHVIPNLRWIIPFLRDHARPDSDLLGAVVAYL